MKLFSCTVLVVFVSFFSIISAQAVADLSIPHVVYNPVENTMCVPVIANRYQEVVAHQFELRFDPAQLEFRYVRSINEGFVENHNVFHNFMAGQLRCIYWAPDTITSLPDTTILVEVCFAPKTSSGYSPVFFDTTSINLLLDENDQRIAPASLVDGSLTFSEGAPVPLHPGDTNADGIVDHTDLLNIGLAYGAIGPARTTPVDFFTLIEAQPWPQNLLDDTNFANIDADGNGTIDEDDVATLNDFYGQKAPGLWNPDSGTSTGRSTNPALYLGGVDTINAGELTTLPIYLGDDDNWTEGGNGLAFTLEFNTNEIDAASLTISLENSFLGDNLLSIAKVTESGDGRFEVALIRKDLADAPSPLGPALVGNLTFRALNNTANENYQLNLTLTPDAYIAADQSVKTLSPTSKEIEVNGTVSNQDHFLVRGINIYPNPTWDGMVTLYNLPANTTEISLYSVQGQLLARYSNAQRSLNLTQQPMGVYILRIVVGAQEIRRRVVKGF